MAPTRGGDLGALGAGFRPAGKAPEEAPEANNAAVSLLGALAAACLRPVVAADTTGATQG